jgi:trehalose-6-phosphate synthase
MITFQAPQYFVDFISWFTREIPEQSSYWASRAVDACAVLPIGIDVSGVMSISQSQSVSRKCDSLRNSFKGKKIVLSYNTLDTRGEMDDVVMGLDRMLAQNPRWKEKVVLLQIICSSRAGESFGEYSISPFGDLTDPANARDDSWELEHVQYYKGQVSELEFHALLRASDTAIFPFTPGGPITAGLEYFICRQGDNKRPIISDTSPIAHQIPEAITYRQGDIDSIAKAINYALVLSDWPLMEKRHREEHGRGIMITAEHWTNSVLYSLADKLLKSHFQMKPLDAGSYDSGSLEGSTGTEYAPEVSSEEESGGGADNGRDNDGRGRDGGGDGGGESERNDDDREVEKDEKEDIRKEDSEEDTETEDDEQEATAVGQLKRSFMRVEREEDLGEEMIRKRSATV